MAGPEKKTEPPAPASNAVAVPSSAAGNKTETASIARKPNPTRFTAASAALVQSPEDREYFRTRLAGAAIVQQVQATPAQMEEMQDARERHAKAIASMPPGLMEEMREMRERTSPSRELERVMTRLPDGMRDRLKAAADAANRSVNAEIVFRLEQSFEIEPFLANIRIGREKLESQAFEIADIAERYKTIAAEQKSRADELQGRLDRLKSDG